MFEKVVEWENLYMAFRKAWKGSNRSNDAQRFNFRLEGELLRLKQELMSLEYQPGEFRFFKIHDPKERMIAVAPFRDRVVHHAIVGVLEPIYEKIFIFDSYATRKGKGTHCAIKRTQYFLQQNHWFLKTDVDKYFDSVDHEILIGLLRRKIKDPKLLLLLEKIIRNGGNSGKGVPVGNLTSQFFANVYLDPLDHYLKDQLGIRHYVRYMDDMVVLSSKKEEVKAVRGLMETFLNKTLALRLKEKVTFINSRENGLRFLGVRIFPGVIKVARANMRRIAHRMADRHEEYQFDLISEEKFLQSINSMTGYLGYYDKLYLLRSFFYGQQS